MANEGDLSSASEQFHLQVSLQQHRNQAASRLSPKGSCHYCHRKVETPKVFCDEDCAEDHAYELKRLSVNGRRH